MEQPTADTPASQWLAALDDIEAALARTLAAVETVPELADEPAGEPAEWQRALQVLAGRLREWPGRVEQAARSCDAAETAAAEHDRLLTRYREALARTGRDLAAGP